MDQGLRKYISLGIFQSMKSSVFCVTIAILASFVNFLLPSPAGSGRVGVG